MKTKIQNKNKMNSKAPDGYYRYIYKITCTNGSLKNHFYYGKHTTKNINDNYKGSGVLLKDYYKTYPNDYIKEIISFYNTPSELNKAEFDIINSVLGTEMCLNLNIGGAGGSKKGSLSVASRKKISESLKGRPSQNKGKKMPPEFGQKVSKSCMGRKSWNEGLRGTGICKSGFKGKHFSEESRKKMSKQRKGRIPWNKGLKLNKLTNTYEQQ